MNNRLDGKVILVVDDEPGYREVLSDEFEHAGAKVITAASGNEAIETFSKQTIDLIVSDIRMPNGTGVELLDYVKSTHFHTPVVMLITGHSDLSEDDAYDKGAEAIFSKPCDLEALIRAAERALLSKEWRWKYAPERIPTDLHIEIKIDSVESAIQAKVINIGRGGMFLSLDSDLADLNEKKPPVKGDRVSFSLRGVPGTTFQGSALCRWVRHKDELNLPAGIGVEFLELTDPSVQFLSGLLNNSTPRSFIPKGPLEQ